MILTVRVRRARCRGAAVRPRAATSVPGGPLISAIAASGGRPSRRAAVHGHDQVARLAGPRERPARSRTRARSAARGVRGRPATPMPVKLRRRVEFAEFARRSGSARSGRRGSPRRPRSTRSRAGSSGSGGSSRCAIRWIASSTTRVCVVGDERAAHEARAGLRGARRARCRATSRIGSSSHEHGEQRLSATGGHGLRRLRIGPPVRAAASCPTGREP